MDRNRDKPRDYKHQCPAVLANPEATHNYEFDMRIVSRGMNEHTKFIMIQWHGTPAETKMKDAFGCVSRIPYDDFASICKADTGWYECKNGVIREKTSSNNRDYWSNVGIEQEQGGYPPLTFAIQANYFYIYARSVPAYYKHKGMCPFPKDSQLTGTEKTEPWVEKCDNSPDAVQPSVALLWKTPIRSGEIPLDQWFHFRWEVKWSMYKQLDAYVDGQYATTNGSVGKV